MELMDAGAKGPFVTPARWQSVKRICKDKLWCTKCNPFLINRKKYNVCYKDVSKTIHTILLVHIQIAFIDTTSVLHNSMGCCTTT